MQAGPGYGQAPPPGPYGYPPYGYAYGYGYRQQPPTGTNGMAIAALVLGIVGFLFVTPIVGLVLGLVSLSAVRKSGQKGRGLAISGIVLSSLWIALFATLITVAVAIIPDPAQRDANGTVIKAGAVSVFALHPRDCFTVPPGLMGSTKSNTRTFKVVPCSTPHDSEAMGTFTATDGSYPGTEGLRAESASQCVTMLSSFLTDPASLPMGSRVQYVFPNQPSWDRGEHRVTCFVQFPAATMTQSVYRDPSTYTADQLRFLGAARPLTEALSRLNASLESADISTLQERANAIATAAQAEIAALTSSPWPADVQPAVDTLVARHRELVALWTHAASADDVSTFDGDVRGANAAYGMADVQAVRTALGLTTVGGGSGGGSAQTTV